MMKSFRIGALAFASLASAPALAGTVSYVSVRGTDTGTCAAIATPCRTFAYALGQTDAHGEIFAIAPGNYGPVTVNKSVSITGTVDGAGINTWADSHQIRIAAGVNDLVYLSGLTLDGGATDPGTVGVLINTAGRVIIRKCAVRNHSDGGGVGLFTNAYLGRLLLEDDAFSKGSSNIVLNDGPAVLHRVSEANTDYTGIRVSGGSMISESSFSGGNIGIELFGPTFFLTRSAISGYSAGVLGNIRSAGNNLFRGNTTNVTGAVTNIGTK